MTSSPATAWPRTTRSRRDSRTWAFPTTHRRSKTDHRPALREPAGIATTMTRNIRHPRRTGAIGLIGAVLVVMVISRLAHAPSAEVAPSTAAVALDASLAGGTLPAGERV